jgi:magnesium-protoporphyrin O-methyltransferase
MLLKSGAANAQGVEISEGMILAAKKLAEEMGLDARVRHHRGDFVTLNGEITASDIVILDKVLCCYADHNELISKSAEKATDIYAVSYPRNSLLSKLMFRSAAWFGELLRWSFHPYYHETVELDRAITNHGFREIFADTTVIWQIKIFRRQEVSL